MDNHLETIKDKIKEFFPDENIELIKDKNTLYKVIRNIKFEKSNEENWTNFLIWIRSEGRKTIMVIPNEDSNKIKDNLEFKYYMGVKLGPLVTYTLNRKNKVLYRKVVSKINSHEAVVPQIQVFNFNGKNIEVTNQVEYTL